MATRILGTCAGCIGVWAAAGAAEPSATTALWYEKPAQHWVEALPIGNGRMGAMVFGGIATEHIQFNEQTLWLGSDRTKDMGGYQPFGDLYLDFAAGSTAATDYRRELDLDRALSRVTYTLDGVNYIREAFASHPAGVVVLRVTASARGKISGALRLTDAHAGPIKAESNSLRFSGALANGLAYSAASTVLADGGRVVASADRLNVEGADALTVILAAATAFDHDPRKRGLPAVPAAAIERRLAAAAATPYPELLRAHVADHEALFRRVQLDLGTTAGSAKPTVDRLVALKAGATDPALAALLFNYGRYLMIASSRPGGLPANLQGLWNADLKPAWFSGYTTNINIEMNYWLAEPTALPECAQPYFDWVELLASVQKKSEDPKLKTPVGWIIYSTNNPFGGNTAWAIHQPGSAWLAQHFWEHYAFSGDRDFLARRAYPMLKELVQYWDGRLVPGPENTLITPDGWSPEHGPVLVDGKIVLKEGDRTPIPGVSYDQQIVWDLFTNFIEASEALGTDLELRRRIVERRARLLGPKIGRWGQLQEWMEDLDDPKDAYRHISHLFALHPGRQIAPSTTAALADAAKVTLNARGDRSVGWSRAWKICFWARLLDGDRAESLLRGLLLYVPAGTRGSGSYANLFGAGPPFQIDANFGATAGITEMLLQSHLRGADGRWIIDLLPALPKAWPTGSVTGLRARGGFDVSFAWKDGHLISATILSRAGQPGLLRLGGETRALSLARGESDHWTAAKTTSSP